MGPNVPTERPILHKVEAATVKLSSKFKPKKAKIKVDTATKNNIKKKNVPTLMTIVSG